MNLVNAIIFWLGTSLTVVVQLFAYKKLSDTNKPNIKLYHILLVMACGLIITFNSYSFDSTIRAFISYSAILLLEYLIYKDTFTKTTIIATISYILVVISEIILSVVVLNTHLFTLKEIDSNIIYKVIFSMMIVGFAYLGTYIKIVKIFSKKVLNLLQKSFVPLIILFILLIVVINIAFKNVAKLSITAYFSNIILLITFLILIMVIFYNEYKISKEVDKTNVLLDFIVDYEKKIDEDRINRHEMLNNLLILKSYSNKNSKKYNDTLDDLINAYNNSTGIKNIYKLPSGLKGIIYYKINEINNKNMNININISKQLTNEFEKMDHKTYAKVCKIVGITFDNAIEAASQSKKKYITLDVYEEKDGVVIDIENSFKEKIDVKKINNKYYSTKGKNRGLGLYIVNNLIKSSNDIILDQFIENELFITKLTIKKSR